MSLTRGRHFETERDRERGREPEELVDADRRSPLSDATPRSPSSRAVRKSTSVHRTLDMSAPRRSLPANVTALELGRAELGRDEHRIVEADLAQSGEPEVGVVELAVTERRRRATSPARARCHCTGSR